MTGVQDILDRYDGERRYLIPMLQDIQEEFRYLSPSSIEAVADHLRLSEHEVYGVATFYAQFRYTEPGEHTLRICRGTACHVRGGHDILNVVTEGLAVSHGQTTEDGVFTLEEVACLGCCALAPVIVLDEDIHGMMNPSKINKLIKSQQKSGGDE